MPKKMKKQEDAEVQVEAEKDLLDGGIVSTVISKEMRSELNSVAARLDRKPAWVQREALKQYLSAVAV